MNSNLLINGLKWSILEKFSVVFIQILLEVILARLLLPTDYGILGMIMIVVAFANVFVDGGISSALIHYKDRKEADYAVVFYSSICIGILSYLIIYFGAPYLSNYYNINVTLPVRIIGLSVLFNSFGIIYRAKLSINMDFKKQTLYSIISILVSGILAVYLAAENYGVWALVIQLVVYSMLLNFFLFLNDRFFPKPKFNKYALNRIFGFGSKIFIASILHSVYLNAFPLLLGRFYNASVVGLYTKSNQVTTFPAGLFTSTIQRVVFPYLVEFQHDKSKVYQFNLKFLKIYSLLAFPVIAWIIFYAQPIILFIFSVRWESMVMPFRFLLAACAFFPIIIMNMNVFQVIGKVNIYMYTEIITKVFGIIIVLSCYKFGFFYVCLGILLQFLLQFVITAIMTGWILQASTFQQLFRIGTIALLNSGIFLLAWVINQQFNGQIQIIWVMLCLTILYGIIVKIFFVKDLSVIITFIKSKFDRK